MFSGFFGKGDKNVKPPTKEVGKARGVEVIEDDPDTAWSLWDDALAEQDSRFPTDGPNTPPPTKSGSTPALADVDFDIASAPTQPMSLEELTPEQRKDIALQVVELHHQRIANTIRTLWGYKECSVYIYKLIMNGGDGMGHARVGFNQDAAEAMLALADIHDLMFGPATASQPDFTETTRGSVWGKFR
jgi:hypothetical protein